MFCSYQYRNIKGLKCFQIEEVHESYFFNELNYRYEAAFYPYRNPLLCFPFTVCVYHRQSQWTKAEFVRTNPVDSAHSVLYNENKFLYFHNLWGFYIIASRWNTHLSFCGKLGKGREIESVFIAEQVQIPWWSFSLLRMFIMRRILWVLLSEIHQYLLEQTFLAKVNKISPPYFFYFLLSFLACHFTWL